MRSTIFVLVLLLISSSGCVMVREGNVTPPVQWPPHSNQQVKKSIALKVIDAGHQEGASQGASLNGPEKDYLAQAVKAYTESGLFSSVVTTSEPADLRADITIIEKGGDGLSWSGAISALTLTMIPGVVSQDLIANTSFKDRQQKVIGIVEKNEGLKSWIQFFLLFSMPFVNGPNTIINTTQYDLHRATIEEAQRNGFF